MIIGRLAGLLEVKMITYCVLRVACCEVRGNSFGFFDFGFDPPARTERLATRLPCKARAGRDCGFRIAKRGWAKFGLRVRAAGYALRVVDRRISGTMLAL